MIKLHLSVIFTLILSLNTYEQESENITAQKLELINQFIIQNRIDEIKKSEFSLKLLNELLTLYDVPYKKYIIRQAILETGNFTSTIFQENHNLLGMKHPRVRSTTSIGINRGHAAYIHWTDSVEDYLLWIDYYKNRGYDTTEYFKFLCQVGYAEDPNYIYKLINLNYI